MLGWEVEVKRVKSGKIISVKFHDPLHNTDMEFDSLASANAKHLFDMENKGRDVPDDLLTKNLLDKGIDIERRNFRDVVRMLYELPDENKDATPLIVFDNRIAEAPAFGEHMYTTNENSGHVVRIYGLAFNKNTNKFPFNSAYDMRGHSLERTILHETYHSLDYMSSPNSNSATFGGNGLSIEPKFTKAINTIGDGSNAITSNVGSKTRNGQLYYPKGSSGFHKESFADAKSIVRMQEIGKGNEYVMLGNGKVVTVDQWCDKYKELVGVVRDLTVSKNDFLKPESVNTAKGIRKFL